MAAQGARQHNAALPCRSRLYDWRRVRPRDVFNRAARDLRLQRVRPLGGRAAIRPPGFEQSQDGLLALWTPQGSVSTGREQGALSGCTAAQQKGFK